MYLNFQYAVMGSIKPGLGNKAHLKPEKAQQQQKIAQKQQQQQQRQHQCPRYS